MKLTVIGHWGGYPKANEASSGYLVEHEGFCILIDCGSGVLSFLQSHIQVQDLDACILSHYHPDHIADIGVLQHALLIQRVIGNNVQTLPVYAHTEDAQGFQSLQYKDLMEGVAYNPKQSLEVGPFTITFLKTKHPVPCYAMRIQAGDKVLVYTADTSYLEEFILFSKDADLLLCESNLYGGMDATAAGHMTSVEAGRLARQANVAKLVLTHLPHFGDIEDLKKEAEAEFSGQVMLASKDLVLQL